MSQDRAAPTCVECRFALLQDTGYSNYTVEGTDFYCLIGAHPDDGFDSWYGEDSRLQFATQCPRFEAGEPVEMDVDGEIILSETNQALYDAWCG